ncbi:MAG: transglycosylase SLT domain-containing protein [bacterium]
MREKNCGGEIPKRTAARGRFREIPGYYGVKNEGGPPGEIAGALSSSLQVPASLLSFHAAFGGGVRWRLTREGVEVEGTGIERTRGEPSTVRRVWNDFGGSIERWAAHYRVPAELILATICTESGGLPDRVRIEPGHESDAATPKKVSPGLMQTLIATAREALKNEVDEDIDREWLLVADNSIRAGTAYIAFQKSKTDFDPPKAACAYNAGGIYVQTGPANRWKMRQYPIGTSHHADRFVKWINDFFSLIASGETRLSGGYFE